MTTIFTEWRSVPAGDILGVPPAAWAKGLSGSAVLTAAARSPTPSAAAARSTVTVAARCARGLLLLLDLGAPATRRTCARDGGFDQPTPAAPDVARADDLALAAESVVAIVERGFGRDRDLATDLAALVASRRR